MKITYLFRPRCERHVSGAERESKILHPDIRMLFTRGYRLDIIQSNGFPDMEQHFIRKPVSPALFCRNVRESPSNAARQFTSSVLKRLHLCSIICIILILSFAATSGAASPQNILVLNSYHQGYKWTDDETRGIMEGLAPAEDDIKLYIEYMGTKWSDDPQYLALLRDTFKHKFRGIPFSVILVTDNDAFDFMRLYRDEVFGRVPVVFCGVNWFKDEYLHGQTLFTGVNEDADIAATVDVMLKLHPQTRTIFAVMDSTTTGKIIRERIQELAPRYQSKVAFRLLEGMDMDEILKTVASAPDGSLVLLTVFQKDKSGVFFEFSESTMLLSRASRVPVYGLWDFNLGYGIVGGMLTSGSAQGRSAAELALRIIRGESPDALPVLKNSPNKYMFDSLQLTRYGLAERNLPRGSIIVNQPPSFYAVNRTLVWSVIGGMLFLGSAIVVLLVNIHQRRKAQEDLQKAHDELDLRVKARTADLLRTNEMLQSENAERKRAENEIKDLNAELSEFNQEIATLVSERTMNLMALAVADKVRNPAAVIGAACHRIIEKSPCSGGLPADLRESLSLITDSSEKLEQIVSDFQSLLRDRQAVFGYVDLNQIVEHVIHLIRREAESKSVEIGVHCSEQPLMMNARQNLLAMALLHILKNAVEATPPGGRVRVSTSRQGDSILLIVHDTGPGVAKENIQNIFEAFYSTKEHSFGMGLPLAKQVIAEHMGDIAVESEPGAGTTFRVTLPSRWKEKQRAIVTDRHAGP
ncbi:MAG TPA: sensor histidine kinase [Dissulfurispiraceae bacterium]|nr:sensor histidine kinase [Dissulfurispiraceae bacterium]